MSALDGLLHSKHCAGKVAFVRCSEGYEMYESAALVGSIKTEELAAEAKAIVTTGRRVVVVEALRLESQAVQLGLF